jgi:hypothetical protein
MHYALQALPGFSRLPASTCRDLINRRRTNGGGTRGGCVSAVRQKEKQPTTCARWRWRGGRGPLQERGEPTAPKLQYERV